MARLLVVSRSMALALRLADAHDVVELPVDDLDAMVPGPQIDAVVLDVGEPALAIQTLDRLRGAGDDTPLLIVSGYQPAWAGIAAVDIPGVVVVPLPITRSALLDGIDLLVAGRAGSLSSPVTAAATGRPRPPAVASLPADEVIVDSPIDHVLPAEPVRVDTGSRGRSARGDDPQPAEDSPDLLRPFIRTLPPAGSGTPQRGWAEPGFNWWHEPTPTATAQLDPVHDSVTDWAQQPPAPGGAARPPTAPSPAPPSPQPPSPPPPSPPPPVIMHGSATATADVPAQTSTAPPADSPDATQQVPTLAGPAPGGLPSAAQRQVVGQLVEQLTDRIGDVFGVADTAQLLAERLVVPGRAAAAALLVPDGGLWRVSGGVGLRPVERRLALDGSHWLIEQVAVAGRALALEDTDAVRQRLAGAPLASWRYLLAAPVPAVQAVVVLARGNDARPFSGTELTALLGPLQTATELLEAALRARHLARLLAPLREVPPPR